MALNSLYCADLSLSNYSLTHSTWEVWKSSPWSLEELASPYVKQFVSSLQKAPRNLPLQLYSRLATWRLSAPRVLDVPDPLHIQCITNW